MAESKSKNRIYKVSLTAVYGGDEDIDLNGMADAVFKSMKDADDRLMMLRVDTIKQQKSVPKAMQADIDKIIDDMKKKANK